MGKTETRYKSRFSGVRLPPQGQACDLRNALIVGAVLLTILLLLYWGIDRVTSLVRL